ncbi:hypothetical protein [Asticcacaulis sp.]|uniref:hypothetical protein n=1 Tax=Asticcacaulis sp. TaxID=1872648 RepID=UPI002605ABB2|nr:hypothetical protein [Asticcacaulis sp.]
MTSALAAVTAAVVGVILNLAIWFALHTVFQELRPLSLGPIQVDWPVWGSLDVAALVLSAGAIVAAFKFKVGMAKLLGVCAAAGFALHIVSVIG